MPCNLGPRQPGHHGGVKSFGDDVERMVEEGACGAVYLALEECLGEHGRDWRRCQAEVKALAACNKRAAAAPGGVASAAAALPASDG